jgi:hypothetical protein
MEGLKEQFNTIWLQDAMLRFTNKEINELRDVLWEHFLDDIPEIGYGIIDSIMDMRRREDEYARNTSWTESIQTEDSHEVQTRDVASQTDPSFSRIQSLTRSTIVTSFGYSKMTQ